MNAAPPARILIADDEPLFLKTTGDLLQQSGYECRCVADAPQALAALDDQPFDLLIADLKMPGNLKLELLEQGRSRFPHVPLIVVTGAPSLPSAIESIRLRIADYLLKPVKFDDLLASVNRALSARESSQPLADAPFIQNEQAPEIVGKSPALREALEFVERVSQTDVHVLITGESGVGKEVAARTIHARSRRAKHAFCPIDCTTIPESLAESVLFGHAKGSFTGAFQDQQGLLQQCDGGTAFLDEIGDLPLASQAKLLRVVQQGRFTPVGRASEVAIDARFISATHRNLADAIAAGQFRRDLFYRIAVVQIHLPPLRERGDDVILLAERFLKQLAPINPRVRDFSGETFDLFRRYAWPGNVRELRNCIEHALSLARGELLEPADLPPTIAGADVERRIPAGRAPRNSRLSAMADAERQYVAELLTRHRGNVSRCAQEAGMTRQGFHKLLSKLGVAASEYRREGRS
ncbi:MAG TPA: sigma-54 dependent transcriptional regulator [Pirellulales bacterium]|nr:sigma-54 dependent transcriptional regulator [Pirellulales bacterium]